MSGYDRPPLSQGEYYYQVVQAHGDNNGARLLDSNNIDVADDDYFDEGFEDYVVKTTDPGSLALLVATAVSLAMIAMVPVFVWIGEKLKKRRKHLKRLRQERQESRQPARAPLLNKSGFAEQGLVASDKDRIPECTGTSAKQGPYHECPVTRVEITLSPKHGDRTQDLFVSRDSTNNNNSEDGTVKEAARMDKSCASNNASKSSAILRAGEAEIALNSQRKKSDPPGTHHKYLPRFLFRAAPPTQPIEPATGKGETGLRADVSVSSSSASSVLRRLSLKGVEQIVDEYLATGEIYRPKERDLRQINGTGQAMEIVFGCGIIFEEDDSVSSRVTRQSLPGKRVGVAATDGEGDDSSLSPSPSSSSDADKGADENLKYCSKLVKSMGQYKFYRCDRDMRGIIKLAVPFTIHSFAVHIFDIMELALVGQFIGTNALSAYLVVDFAFSLSVMFMEGSLTSLFTLCSQAVGTRNFTLAGQYVQIATLFYQLMWLPFGVLWYFFLEDVVLWLDFEQDVAGMAFGYAQVAFIWYLFRVYTEVLHYLLEVTDHENYTALMSITAGAARFTTILLMAKNVELSLRDVGIIHLVIEVLFAFIEAIVQVYTGWLSDYWGGMLGTFAPFNRQAVRNFLKTAVPLSFGYILSYGEWEVLAVFAGFMGPAEVSAWGLLGNFWEAIEEVSSAVGDAAEVRTANMLGSNQPARAKSIAHKGIFVGVIVSFLFSIPIYAMRGVLPSLFTKDETLQGMISALIPYVCVGNIVLMFGSMCWTLLGAQGRYGLATALGFVGSWIVTLPLSALLTIYFNFDLQGLAAAVVVGYSFSGALTAAFLFRSNWEKLSEKVMRNMTEEGAEHTAPTSGEVGLCVDYEDYDWDELPEEVQLAASKLGYDKRMWNKGKEPVLCQRLWDELEPEQQEAARVLGYTNAKWDDDD